MTLDPGSFCIQPPRCLELWVFATMSSCPDGILFACFYCFALLRVGLTVAQADLELPVLLHQPPKWLRLQQSITEPNLDNHIVSFWMTKLRARKSK